MATDTGVNVDKCGSVDMNSCDDLHPTVVGGAGGDGKEDYVFINGSDVALEDRGRADGDGELSGSKLIVDLHENVGEDGAKINDEDHGQLDRNGKVNGFESNVDLHENVDEDAIVNDPGKRGRDGDLDVNASKSNVDSHDRVDGGDPKVNGDDQMEENCSAEIKKINNESKTDEGELKTENGVNVEAKSEDKIEVGDLDQQIAEIESQSDVTVEHAKGVLDNGGSDGVEGVIDIKDKNFEVEEVKDTEPIVNGLKVGEPCVQEEDGCDSSSDCTNVLVVDNDLKTSDTIVADRGSGVGTPVTIEEQNGIALQGGDGCDPSSDYTNAHALMADSDHKTSDTLVVDRGSGGRTPETVEEQNGIALLDSTPLVRDGDTEQSHLAEPQGHEDQNSKPETLQLETGKLQLVEDNIQSHVDEVPVREMVPVDSNVKEAKPMEAIAGNEFLEDEIHKVEAPEGNVEGPHVTESSEPQSMNGGVNVSLMDDPVQASQSLVCPPTELQLADKETEDKGPIETEDVVKEHDHAVPPAGARNQVLSNADSETVKSEVIQSEDDAVSCEDATHLTSDSEEVKELHTVPVKFENESGLDSSALEMEKIASDRSDHSDINNAELSRDIAQSQTCNKASPDCEMKVNGHGESDLTAEVAEGQECSAENVCREQMAEETGPVEDVCHDQMEEETGSVTTIGKENLVKDADVEKMDEEIDSLNVADKGNSSETLDLGKPIAVKETTSVLKVESANWADEVERVDELDGIGSLEHKIPDLVNHSKTVTESREICGDEKDCLRTENSDSNSLVDRTADMPAPSDLDTVKDKEVSDNASHVIDNSRSNPAENNNSLLDVENTNLQIRAENGDDGAVNKPKINFGFFECEAPFSHSDIIKVRPEVLNRSVEFTSSKSEAMPSESVLNSEANGVHFGGHKQDKSSGEDLVEERSNKDETSSSPLQGSGIDAIDGQNLNTEVVRRPFYYLIRLPRYDDEKLRDRIRLSEMEVEEKTRHRDSVRVEYQKIKATLSEHKSHFQAAKSEERAARDLVVAKKREIDSAQSLINLAKKDFTVDDVESRIANMEHTIQHVTMNLNEEKLLVREIEQLKSLRSRLSKNKRSQEKVLQAIDQRVEVEEHLKVLRKEMDVLRDNLSKAEESTKVARKKYDDQSSLLNELYLKFTSADAIRQKAYEDLVSVRKQRNEKNKHFWSYKDAAKAANEYAMAGNKDGLECHCVNQVEKFMELWNKNDEFRKEYIRCNTRSTLRRFRTLDGRSLGPNEEPPFVGIASDDRVVVSSAKANSVAKVQTTERKTPLEPKKVVETPAKKVTEQKSKIAPVKKIAEVTPKNSSTEALSKTETSIRTEVEEEKEEAKPTKEQLEAEKLRREEEAARMREQHRLEEKAKAKEALERKRKMAEKAQARAEFKARKEAEEKEKKRAKKKENKRGLNSNVTETEPAVLAESSSETIKEPKVPEKPVTMAKKPSKPSSYTKQIKTTKAIPPPIRNRGKKRMKQWMLILVPILFALALFYLGNTNFFRNKNWNVNFGSPF